MTLLFWCSALLIGYAYVGYALLLVLEARFHRMPPACAATASFHPTISIVMAVRNEADALRRKIANLHLLEYPADRLEVIVVSDGSTDQTAAVLAEHAPFVQAVLLPHSGGKAAALNQAVFLATGEILVFFDVRQAADRNAVTELVACFADSAIGAVSGELLLETESGRPSPDALGIYWKIEKMVRRLESETGSVVGATGAIYAIRRELFVAMPPGTILDDVFIPMQVARQGRRVVFQSSAIARDRIFREKGKEFSRKVRTLTGNYQLLQLAPWMLSPANPLLFRLISHKLMRLVVPLLLVLLLVASVAAGGWFYRTVFLLQVLFYGLAALGWSIPSSRQSKVVSVAYTFTMLNAAAAMAFYNIAVGRKNVWT